MGDKVKVEAREPLANMAEELFSAHSVIKMLLESWRTALSDLKRASYFLIALYFANLIFSLVGIFFGNFWLSSKVFAAFLALSTLFFALGIRPIRDSWKLSGMEAQVPLGWPDVASNSLAVVLEKHNQATLGNYMNEILRQLHIVSKIAKKKFDYVIFLLVLLLIQAITLDIFIGVLK